MSFFCVSLRKNNQEKMYICSSNIFVIYLTTLILSTKNINKVIIRAFLFDLQVSFFEIQPIHYLKLWGYSKTYQHDWNRITYSCDPVVYQSTQFYLNWRIRRSCSQMFVTYELKIETCNNSWQISHLFLKNRYGKTYPYQQTFFDPLKYICPTKHKITI